MPCAPHSVLDAWSRPLFGYSTNRPKRVALVTLVVPPSGIGCGSSGVVYVTETYAYQFLCGPQFSTVYAEFNNTPNV